MKSSYLQSDVEILLKDVTGLIEPLPTHEREKRIQSGTHYSEMLPLEYRPSDKYMASYQMALDTYGKATADAVARLSEKLYKLKGSELVVVSLARAGIPIGILIKRYILKKYGADIKHYAVSIIRGKGIDQNAIRFILDRHKAESISFIDGWIGKGAILGQLRSALRDYPSVSTDLGVVSDPANLTELCGTHEDILIPSSCLNAVVTGLISRTILNPAIIGENDFHGAVYYKEMEAEDLSYDFIKKIEEQFEFELNAVDEIQGSDISGKDIVEDIKEVYGISDINYIKPGIGEATRVLLRRLPWKIIVSSDYLNAKELKHIRQLASDKNVPYEISRVPLGNYKVCGIIRELADA